MILAPILNAITAEDAKQSTMLHYASAQNHMKELVAFVSLESLFFTTENFPGRVSYDHLRVAMGRYVLKGLFHNCLVNLVNNYRMDRFRYKNKRRNH